METEITLISKKECLSLITRTMDYIALLWKIEKSELTWSVNEIGYDKHFLELHLVVRVSKVPLLIIKETISRSIMNHEQRLWNQMIDTMLCSGIANIYTTSAKLYNQKVMPMSSFEFPETPIKSRNSDVPVVKRHYVTEK